jgi:predicted metal-binding protein
LAHNASEVRLVGEAECGGDLGQRRRVVLQLLKSSADPDAIAIAGQRDTQFPRESPTQSVRRYPEQFGKRK